MVLVICALLVALGFLLMFTASINLLTSPKIQLGWMGLALWCLAEFILLIAGSGLMLHGR